MNINDAYEKLHTGGKDFTRSGAVEVSALSAMLGRMVTSKERNAAHSVYIKSLIPRLSPVEKVVDSAISSETLPTIKPTLSPKDKAEAREQERLDEIVFKGVSVAQLQEDVKAWPGEIFFKGVSEKITPKVGAVSPDLGVISRSGPMGWKMRR